MEKIWIWIKIQYENKNICMNSYKIWIIWKNLCIKISLKPYIFFRKTSMIWVYIQRVFFSYDLFPLFFWLLLHISILTSTVQFFSRTAMPWVYIQRVFFSDYFFPLFSMSCCIFQFWRVSGKHAEHLKGPKRQAVFTPIFHRLLSPPFSTTKYCQQKTSLNWTQQRRGPIVVAECMIFDEFSR